MEVMNGEGTKDGGVRAEVRITSVAPQDSSVIACTATNKYGTHIHHMELQVQGEQHQYNTTQMQTHSLSYLSMR